MAAISGTRTVHPTLTGVTVDVVTLTTSADAVTVLNRVGTDPLWVRIDGVDPVARAEGTYVVPPGSFVTVPVTVNTTQIEVRVLGNGNEYSVEETF